MQVAQGAQLIEIIHVLPKLQDLMRSDHVEDTIVPMLMQALERGDNVLQEEVSHSVAKTSTSFVAETSVKLTQKVFMFIIY